MLARSLLCFVCALLAANLSLAAEKPACALRELTPDLGLDAAGRSVPAARADLVLVDRWLTARHGSRLQPWRGGDAAAPWAARCPVTVPGRFLWRTGQRRLGLTLTERYRLGHGPTVTYAALEVRVTTEPDPPSAESPAPAAAAAGGWPTAPVQLPWRPDLLTLLPDRSVCVAEGPSGRLARVRLADGTLLWQAQTQRGLPTALVAQPRSGWLYRCDSIGRVQTWRLADGRPGEELVLPRDDAVDLPRVKGAVLDPMTQQVLVIGADRVWTISADGEPRPAVRLDGHLPEVVAWALAPQARTLWLLGAPDDEHPPTALPLRLDQHSLGEPRPVLTDTAGDPLRGATLAAPPSGATLYLGAATAGGSFVGQIAASGATSVMPVAGFSRAPTVAVAPDGRHLALWQTGGRARQVVVASLDARAAADDDDAGLRVPVQGASQVVFSEDGRRLIIADAGAHAVRVIVLGDDLEREAARPESPAKQPG